LTNSEEKSVDEKIANANSLIQSGKEVAAVYDSVYTEFKQREKVLEKYIKYSFTVDGKLYTGEKTIANVPVESTFTLIYLPANPNIHSENPQQDLEFLNKRKAEGFSGFWPWTLFFASIAVFFITRRSYLKGIQEAKDDERFYKEFSTKGKY
jgi:hypothetical protein